MSVYGSTKVLINIIWDTLSYIPTPWNSGFKNSFEGLR